MSAGDLADESNKALGTESTGATFADAIDSFHWVGALTALDAE